MGINRRDREFDSQIREDIAKSGAKTAPLAVVYAGILLLLLTCLLFMGCTPIKPDTVPVIVHGLIPNVLTIEVSHESHASVGAPFTSCNRCEDGLTTVSAIAGWKVGGAYLQIGEGVNIDGRNGGGFYGPKEVFTARVGYQFKLK